VNIALAQDTRIGKRKINQDRLGHWRTGQALLMAVADGLGGHPHGEVAAQIAIDALGAAFQREARPVLADPKQFLLGEFSQAHTSIMAEAQRRRLPMAPRTVLVACVVQGGSAYWTHVGDCRLYLVRNGRIEARTRDHTAVQQLVDAGRIREEAAASHPERNRLLQCLGSDNTPSAPPVSEMRLEKGDVILLSSDGFWAPLTQRQLMHALLTRPIADAIPELSEAAEARAGAACDNVTVLAMSWNG
jgi:serine/threonine protein phosphatase PrpC